MTRYPPKGHVVLCGKERERWEREGEGMERDHNYCLSEVATHTNMCSPPKFKEGSLREG